MNYRGLSCCLALLALWAQPQAARAAEPCTLKRVAEIPADTSHGALLIKIQIDGHDARVLVDTGSAFNMISPQLAAELKLPLKPVREGAVIDLSGRSIRHMVKVQKVGLGGMTAEDIPFLVLGEDGDKPPPFDSVTCRVFASWTVSFAATVTTFGALVGSSGISVQFENPADRLIAEAIAPRASSCPISSSGKRGTGRWGRTGTSMSPCRARIKCRSSRPNYNC